MATKKPANHALGRGLGALLGDIMDAPLPAEATGDSPAEPGDRVVHLPIAQIDPNREQPRTQFNESALAELADSIRILGVLQPILVVPKDDRYRIIAGERRWRAARMAELTEIPAIVRHWDEAMQYEVALVENLQRQDLNPVEEALGLRALIERCGYTQEVCAQRIGKSRSAIANALRLLSLPDEVLNLLREGQISAGHARALAPLPRERQIKLAELTIQQGWSVRQLERICAQPEKVRANAEIIDERSPEMQQLERMAREAFGTRAKLEGTAQKGRLVLTYTSAEDLEHIWDMLQSLTNG